MNNRPFLTKLWFCFVLIMLSVVLVACRQTSSSQVDQSKRFSTLHFEVAPSKGLVALEPSDVDSLDLSTVTEPGETRILVDGVDSELADYSYEFQSGNRLVIEASFRNITTNFDFEQPFFFTPGPETNNIVSSTEPEANYLDLGSDGLLTPAESTTIFTFEVLHKGKPFTYTVNARAAVKEQSSGLSRSEAVSIARDAYAQRGIDIDEATQEIVVLDGRSFSEAELLSSIRKPLKEGCLSVEDSNFGSIRRQVQLYESV